MCLLQENAQSYTSFFFFFEAIQIPLVPVSTSSVSSSIALKSPHPAPLFGLFWEYRDAQLSVKRGSSFCVQIVDLRKVGGGGESIHSNKDVSKWSGGFFAVLCPLTPTSARNPTLERGTELGMGTDKKSQPGLAKTDVSMLNIFEAGNGCQARRLGLSILWQAAGLAQLETHLQVLRRRAGAQNQRKEELEKAREGFGGER